MDLLREFEEQCPICFNDFSEDRQPVMYALPSMFIAESTAAASLKIACPSCRQTVTLSETKNYKMFAKAARITQHIRE
jgi:hypothetical protein